MFLPSDQDKPDSNIADGTLIRRFKMKATLLALTLLAASGAPVLAEGYPNPYQTTMGR
jgi:hypothetical protein